MRVLRLHLRARGVPAASAGLAVVALLAWWAGSWLADRPFFSGPEARVPVVALAPLLAAALVAPGLGGADEELERSTPTPWRRWRAVHVLVSVAAVSVVLGLTGLRAPETFGAQGLVRNSLGCLGLLTASAVLLGAGPSWAPVFGYVVVVYLAAPRTPRAGSALWAWPMQPGAQAPATLTASALLALGLTAYAWCGVRSVPADAT